MEVRAMESVVEVWIKVDSWPYEVSSFGRVRSLNRHHNGKYGRLLNPGVNKFGYCQMVMGSNGKAKYTTVHALVAAAFIGPRPDGMDINHIDGCKSNNAAANLEYVTRKQNCRHAFAIGLATRERGEKNPTSKLKDRDVMGIKKLLRTKAMTIVEIGSMFGVSKSLIGAIKNQKTWAHVT
jgi:hypothetical protein